MTGRERPRAAAAFAGAAAASLAATLLAVSAPAAAAAADPPVRGLIVRLKNAPAHERMQVRALAAASEREQATALAAREASRWQRVMSEAGLGAGSAHAAPALRPVGRDQQRLHFGANLPRRDAESIASRLRARPDVDWVDFDTRERRLALPDDTFFQSGQQWWLLTNAGSNANVLADRRRGVAGFSVAWQQPGGEGSSAVRVAVLDTGSTNHPDLAGKLVGGHDFVLDDKFSGDGTSGRDADPSDPGDWVSTADLADPHFEGCDLASSSWHGTLIAAQIGAATNNTTGVAGAGWDTRVVPVRVAGKCGADLSDIVDGMRWAAGLAVAGAPANPNPARVVNISFGGSAACGSAYQSAIDELKAIGVVVVAAAGNEHGAPTRPASCSGAVGVVGLNRDGFKSTYSNFGTALTASGIAAVSGDDNAGRWAALADSGILSAGNTGDQGPVSATYYHVWGTSFASPQVAAAVALMLAVNPALTHAQILDGLKRGARPHVTSPVIGQCSNDNPGRCICTTGTCGAGILDAEQALLFAANPATYVAPARTPAVIDNPDVQAAAALGPDRDPNPTPPPDPGNGSGGGGGGAVSAAWLAVLALATLWLRARRPELPRPGRPWSGRPAYRSARRGARAR
jgi:serine protease